MGLLDRIRSSVRVIFEGRESGGESKGSKNDENSFNESDDASTDYDNDTSVGYVESIDAEGNIVGQDGYTYSEDEYHIDEDGLVLDEDGFMIGKLKPDMIHLRGKGLNEESEGNEDETDNKEIEKDIKVRVIKHLEGDLKGVEVTDLNYKKNRTTIKLRDKNGLLYEIVDFFNVDYDKASGFGINRRGLVEIRRHIKVFYPEWVYTYSGERTVSAKRTDDNYFYKEGYGNIVVLDEFFVEFNSHIVERPEGDLYEYINGAFKKWVLINRDYMETVKSLLDTVRGHRIAEVGVLGGNLNRNNILLIDMNMDKVRLIGKNKGLETVVEVGSKRDSNSVYSLKPESETPIGDLNPDNMVEYVKNYEGRNKVLDVSGKSIKESLDILYTKLKDGKSKSKVYKNNPDKKDKLRFERLGHLLKSQGIEFKTGESKSLGNYFTVNIGKGFVLNVTPTTIIDAKESQEMYYKFGDYTYSDLTRKTTKLVKERTGNDKETVMRVLEFIKIYKLSNDLRRNIV